MDRSWMYRRVNDDGFLNTEFISGLETFIEYACSQTAFMDRNKIRCPCKRCKHKRFEEPDTVRYHLVKNGFVPDYYQWDRHGEESIAASSSSFQNVLHPAWNEQGSEAVAPYRQMINDAAGPSFQTTLGEEHPNADDQKFFEMLAAADKALWPGCENVTQLSAIARLLNIKAENNMSESCFDGICQLFHDALPEDNEMVDSFYSTKKLIQGLGLPVVKIDCCRNGCMLYWRNDDALQQCSICGESRYKQSSSLSSRSRRPFKKMWYFPLTPRLKRLYASEKTAAFMRWHDEHKHTDPGVMCHPSDSEAWKHFNITHPLFSAESRNVRLGLCTDGFQPFGQAGQQYSCWPIIITPYNLPPSMCMKEPYMFLTAIVPGPKNPKHKIDVFLQPIISELQDLWEVGVTTFDVSQKQNFQLRAALMWTISDFPAYSMLSGWSTSGKLACPYCMDASQAFSLPKGRKVSWFDNHRKFLPLDHPFRRNKTKFTKNRVEFTTPPMNMTG